MSTNFLIFKNGIGTIFLLRLFVAIVPMGHSGSQCIILAHSSSL